MGVTDLLPQRLRMLGLHDVRDIRLHRNRRVLVSLTDRNVLRLHEGYAAAPDRVLSAIVQLVHPRTRRPQRSAARRVIVSWPVGSASTNREGSVPLKSEDEPVIARLRLRWHELNHEHFAGALQPIPIHLSDRMRRRLGELAFDREGPRATRIVLSRRLVRRHAWREVEETLLHEMVHQWQAETGRPVDHGTGFRAKAREVGITPRAVSVTPLAGSPA